MHMAPSADLLPKTGVALKPQSEIDLSSPLFNAKRYLATTHANTSFPELQTALTELRKTTSDKTAQLKALVSAHFDQYLSCHEAVRVLAADINAHQHETEALVGDIQNLSRRARDQRRIRHTLAVLARLRPILELTSKMKASLRIQDYDKLAVDYARLKHQSGKIANLAAPLKRVVAAGHEIAATANTELLRKLEDMTASVADQKRAIEVLTALALVEKPILTCLAKQFEYLERKLMITLRSEVEMSVGEYPQCWDYIRSVTDPLTAELAEFLQFSVRSLEGASTSSLDEWKRCHLLVESRFFLLALGDLMVESTKTQLENVEKQLVETKKEEAANTGRVTLLNQMKHQAKLYLLALQQ
eukprot:jgi/Phyca11/21433/fgenesh1_pg.PHYCAscaffold_95_\